MTVPSRPAALGSELYAALCDALQAARDWNATPLEIDVLRKAIQNREDISVLTYEERVLASRIAEGYKQRSWPVPNRRKARVATVPRAAPADLDHLSFLADARDAEAAEDNAPPKET